MQSSPSGPAPMYGGLRPLGVGEILDQAIQVYRRNFRALVVMTAVAVVPIEVLTILINLSTRPSSSSGSSTSFGGIQIQTASTGHDGAVVAGAIIVVLLSLISGRLAVGACTRGVSDAYLGGAPADARSSLRVAWRSLGSLLWLELLSVPALIIGFALCIAPGVWLWTSWLVATPVLLSEGARGTHALSRSFHLVKPRFWPTLGLGVLAVLLTTVLGTSLRVLLVGVILATHSTTSTAYIVSAGAVGAVSALLTTPLIAAAYVILYFDLRVRGEGLDIQMVLRNLDSPVAPSTPTWVAPPAATPPWGAPGAPPTWGAPPPPPPPPPSGPRFPPPPAPPPSPGP